MSALTFNTFTPIKKARKKFKSKIKLINSNKKAYEVFITQVRKFI